MYGNILSLVLDEELMWSEGPFRHSIDLSFQGETYVGQCGGKSGIYLQRPSLEVGPS